MINTSLKYNGSASVLVKRGYRTIKKSKTKNSGTPLLFKAIADSISGSNASPSMPRFIRLYESGGASEITLASIPVASSSVATVGSSSSPTGYKTLLNFNIPSGYLYQGKVIKVMKLFSTNSSTAGHLAEIELEDSDTITTDSATSLLVTWTLEVSNPTEQ